MHRFDLSGLFKNFFEVIFKVSIIGMIKIYLFKVVLCSSTLKLFEILYLQRTFNL